MKTLAGKLVGKLVRTKHYEIPSQRSDPDHPHSFIAYSECGEDILLKFFTLFDIGYG